LVLDNCRFHLTWNEYRKSVANFTPNFRGLFREVNLVDGANDAMRAEDVGFYRGRLTFVAASFQEGGKGRNDFSGASGAFGGPDARAANRARPAALSYLS